MCFARMGRLPALLIVPIALFLASCDLFQASSAQAGMGREVLDGKFAFVVTQVNRARTFAGKTAQGVYVIVSMAVRNVGTEAQMFEWSAQRLKDKTGREYSPSFMFPSLFGDVVNSIDPGAQVSIKLAFDVPPDTKKPTQIVLHDSLSSPGVPVNLSESSSPSSRHA